jgi:uncharacterized protein (DUF924 family)
MAKPDPTTIPGEAQMVLRFWFGDEAAVTYPCVRNEWFQKRSEFDTAIRERFATIHQRGAQGELEYWRETVPGALAYVVLFDQFSRNMFRGSAEAFAFDGMALTAAKSALANGFDTQLAPAMRMFFYLPFEHSETLADQERSVVLLQCLAEEEPGLTDMLEYAKRHRDVIMLFGRFPHRNLILRRPSTPEEEAFLKQPGSSF